MAAGGGGGGLVPVIRGGCVYFVSPVSSTLYCMQQPESAGVSVCVSHPRQTTIRVKRLQVAAIVRPAPPRPTTWRLTHCLAAHWQVTLCASCATIAHRSNHGPAGAKRASETHVEVDVHAGEVVPVLSIPGAGPSPATAFNLVPRSSVLLPLVTTTQSAVMLAQIAPNDPRHKAIPPRYVRVTCLCAAAGAAAVANPHACAALSLCESL